MLVTVEDELCEGHGLCTLAAPGVFSFDERGSLRVSERPGVEHHAAVEEAVRTCPAVAIRVQQTSSVDDAS